MYSSLDILLFFAGSLLIAIAAVVYSYILTQNGEVFGGLYGVLDRLFQSDRRACRGLGPHPIFKMIMWCEKCVAGQMSLWIFLYVAFPFYRRGQLFIMVPHALFICLGIFLALCVKKFYTKYIES